MDISITLSVTFSGLNNNFDETSREESLDPMKGLKIPFLLVKWMMKEACVAANTASMKIMSQIEITSIKGQAPLHK